MATLPGNGRTADSGWTELGEQVSGACVCTCAALHICEARVLWALLARIKIMEAF